MTRWLCLHVLAIVLWSYAVFTKIISSAEGTSNRSTRIHRSNILEAAAGGISLPTTIELNKRADQNDSGIITENTASTTSRNPTSSPAWQKGVIVVLGMFMLFS